MDEEAESERLLGCVVNQLQNLELLIRVFLHNNRASGEPAADLAAIEATPLGSVVPLNAFSDYDSLTSLFARMNGHPLAQAAEVRIDPGIITLRDALAHGRKCARGPGLPFRLIKFGRPRDGSVAVEFNAIVTIDWLRKEGERVKAACEQLLRLVGAA